MSKVGVDWDSYLADYHAANPGITERLLNRAHDGQGRNPYHDLVDSFPKRPLNALDVACGSAPVAHYLSEATAYVGVDVALNELRAARAHSDQTQVLLADSRALPFRGEEFDSVCCSMALMLMRPVRPAIGEIGRVLAPGGVLAAMFPTTGPPTRHQLLATSALLTGLRTTPKLPQTLTRRAIQTACQSADLTLINYETRRYTLPLESAPDATDVINGLYLPGTSPRRIAQATRLLARIARPGRSLPLHITQFAAVKQVTRTLGAA